MIFLLTVQSAAALITAFLYFSGNPADVNFNALNFPCHVDTDPGGKWRYQGVLHFIRFKKNDDVITRGEIIVKITVKPKKLDKCSCN